MLSDITKFLISDELNATFNATQAGISFKTLSLLNNSYELSKKNYMSVNENNIKNNELLNNILETQKKILEELKILNSKL